MAPPAFQHFPPIRHFLDFSILMKSWEIYQYLGRKDRFEFYIR